MTIYLWTKLVKCWLLKHFFKEFHHIFQPTYLTNIFLMNNLPYAMGWMILKCIQISRKEYFQFLPATSVFAIIFRLVPWRYTPWERDPLPSGVVYSSTALLISTGYCGDYKYIKGFSKAKDEVMAEDPFVVIKNNDPKVNFGPGSHGGWLLLWLWQTLEENHCVPACVLCTL